MGMTVNKSKHDSFFAKARTERARQIKHAVEAEGVKASNMAKALTNRPAPPIKKGEGSRMRHIGNWADRTGNLARSIGSEISVHGNTLILTWGVISRSGLSGVTITDVIEYAEHLDNMSGYSVLGGIEQAVRNNVRKAVQNILDKKMVSK